MVVRVPVPLLSSTVWSPHVNDGPNVESGYYNEDLPLWHYHHYSGRMQQPGTAQRRGWRNALWYCWMLS